MKRFFALLLVLSLSISLVACGGGASTSTPSQASASPASSAAASSEAAPAETKVEGSLVMYSSMTENDLTNLLSLLEKKYPKLEIEVVNGTVGELIARIEAEKSNPQGDIMWGALSNSDGDRYTELFEHWLSDYEGDVIDAYKSNNGFYNLDHLSTVALCVNTELEKELGITINGYADLLNPKLVGKIILADPNSSSSAWNNVCNIMSVYGNDSDDAWKLIEGLFNNKLVISTSSSACFKSVETGEYVVGLTYEDGISTLIKSGAKNIKMVYPQEGTSASAFGCSVIKNAKNMDAAKAVVNYLMSVEGQNELGGALGTLRMTNSKATFESQYLPKTSEIKWVDRDIAWLVANREQVLKHWNELYTSIYG